MDALIFTDDMHCFVISANDSLSEVVEELAVSTRKAIQALFIARARYTMVSLHCVSRIYLFDALVEPIMLHCSEIWGAMEFNTLEKNLLKLCKYVPASCNITGVLGELGRTSITLDSYTLTIIQVL